MAEGLGPGRSAARAVLHDRGSDGVGAGWVVRLVGTAAAAQAAGG